ncbi:MAG: patatin-like phospholipase family protein [Gemmatimonadetes bacterium]|nr:patatin-like phospholipase family protein [Gemmatimonadota bacterium]
MAVRRAMAITAAALFAFGGPERAAAQDTTQTRATPYPQVTREALVLSGGGSRGLAHAGALVGVEERGYDPDLVVGTSIGALMGALYAAGYPAARIEDEIRAIGWGEMFTPAPLIVGPDRAVRYPLITLDRQTDPLRYNRGIIPQWQINRVLARLLFDANARSRGDFDRLARRYRAVATDLKTGDPVVLARGDLARAARASMAVPGVFAPVEWEGRSLIDGGISDNLPTDVARGFGRRRVIAVDVGRAPKEIQGRSPFAVAGRALDLLEDRAQRDSTPPDVLILPAIDPRETGITFPADPDTLFAVGLSATRRDLPPAGAPATEPRPVPAAPKAFGRLRIEAPDSAVAALTRRVFGGVAPGPYRPERVLSAMDRLYTTGLFEGVWPRVEAGADTAAPDLVVRVEALPLLSAAGAVGYDTDRGGRGWATIQRNTALWNRPAMVMGSGSADRLRQWVSLSGRVFSTWIPSLAWAGGVHWRGSDLREFDDGHRIGTQTIRRAGTWASAEVPRLLHQQMFVAAVRAERIYVRGGERGWSVGPLLRYSTPVAKELDVGVPFLAEAEERWGDFAYRRAAFAGSRAVSLGPLELAAVVQAAAASDATPADALPALGDERAMPGYRWGDGRANVVAVAGLDAAYPFFGGHVRARLRAGSTAARAADLGDRGHEVTGVELGVHRNSIFGVLSAAVALDSRGDRQLFIDLGPRF